MSIIISLENGVVSVSSTFHKELNMSSLEQEASEIFVSLLSDSVDCSKIRLERKSNSYISMIYGEYNDFLRFKFSEKTKWLSIRLCEEDRSKHLENPMFSAQANKNQFHWKSKIDSLSELVNYKDFLINACLKNLL